MDPIVRLKTYAALVDERLAEVLPSEAERPGPLHAAMRHAALAPGKRLRPALVLGVCAAMGGNDRDALDAGCAVELIHAFSLVHDDLPAIDNDELRRGRPTTWKAFGEGVGLLAGDALFALAFVAAPLHAEELGRCALRLVQGETLDVLSEGTPPDAPTLEFIHHHKTGALIETSCAIGAAEAGGDVAKARHYGAALGLAFQIRDDILDEISDAATLGKTAGADRAAGKLTYPAVHGLDASIAKANAVRDEALAVLQGWPGDVEFLRSLAEFAVSRTA